MKHTPGSPLGTMVELVAEWAADGMDVECILRNLEEMIPRCRIYLLVDTPEYIA